MSRFFGVLAVAAIWVVAAPAAGANVLAYDPQAVPAAGAILPDALFESAVDDVMAWDTELAALAPTSSNNVGHDVAVGSQRVTQMSGDFQHVRVSARSGPAGEDPTGSVHVTYQSPVFPGGAADVKGDVDCLEVNGIVAAVAAQLREPFMGNTHVTLFILDGGRPGPTMGQSPDSAFIGFTSAPPATCANAGSFLIGDARGDLLVRDAS